MKSQAERERELITSGMYASIKGLFANTRHNIPDRYFMLMADYIDSVSEVQESLFVNPQELARLLPKLVTSVQEGNIGVYGRTDGTAITMNSNLGYEANKLYFFHELTHALQTRGNNCSFANGKNGMFLAEGATQYTAEILYHVSNGTNINYRNQYNTVRGHSEHTCYSPLSEYQLNGNILFLMSQAMGVPMNKLLGAGFNPNGRESMKQRYESIPGNEGKFEELMNDLEKVYAIDKCIIAGYGRQLSGPPVNITMENGEVFRGNIQTQGELINKVEQDLALNYLMNHDQNYIVNNYQNFARCLTTPQLQQNFIKTVQNIYGVSQTVQPRDMSRR